MNEKDRDEAGPTKFPSIAKSMRKASFGEFIIVALLGCYLIICFSPLRLEYDSIHYFALKDCLEQVCPPGFSAATDPHPIGYPLLLLLLSRLGLLHPFVISFLNLLFLAGALYFVLGIFSKRVESSRPEWAVILLLLSYPFVKFFSYPLSEMPFLFFSCGSLYFFHLYADGRGRTAALLLAFVFAGLAIVIRTAGVVLTPAMMVGLGWRHRKLLMAGKWWVVLALAIFFGGVFFFHDHLGLYMMSVQHNTPGWKVLLREHFMEWGQLLVNVPAGKITGLRPEVGVWLFVAAGAFFVAGVIYCFCRWRKQVPVAVGVYVALYCLMIFCWPFFDVRFWLPVLPFVMVVLLNVSFKRVLLRVLVGVYIFAGVGALGYSIYISFNKQALARTQAGGRYRNEYETFFFGRPVNDTAAQVNPYVLHVLEICK